MATSRLTDSLLQPWTRIAAVSLVAATALKQGHDVTLFLAGDGVHLLAPQKIDELEGQGTGAHRDHIAAIESAGGRFVLSGMSAKARGYDEGILAGHPAQFGMPDVLVKLASEADTVLCY